MTQSATTTPKEITATGMKGFLTWFKREQPGIYKAVAAQLPKIAPAAFSDYNGGGWKTAGMTRAQILRQTLNGSFAGRAGSGISGLADYAGYVDSSIPTFDDSSYGPPPAIATSQVDVASAANSGVDMSSIGNVIGSVLNTASKAYMSVTQAQTQQQIVNTQLARAAAGLPPLNTSLNQYGVPIVSASGTASGGSLLLIIGLGLGALVLMRRK